MSSKKDKSGISRRRFLQATGAVTMASILGVDAVAQPADDKTIVKFSIYPGIGIARIGNSTLSDGYFIGPEVVDTALPRESEARDVTGALKRQAARFRIYGLNQEGRAVRELTAKNAEIEWTVHVANKKAAWYRFISALDIPEATKLNCPLRNADVKGADRTSLVIDPGPKLIQGKNQSGAKFQLEGGKFMGVPVSLGELRTDSEGRLLVLGGLGKSASPNHEPIFGKDPDTFNNADGWYDDTSDGTVEAKVFIDGKEVPCLDSSWVAVAPPNYAPDVIGWRTLYELLVETYVGAKPALLSKPRSTSFTFDVLPMLQRLANLQWVNRGLMDIHSKTSGMDFSNPELIAKLADKNQKELRDKICGRFRFPATADSATHLWPMQYGDAYGSFTDDAANNNLKVSPLPALHLVRWRDGEYDDDWKVSRKTRRKLSEFDIKDQPDVLNRAALHYCLADAFHPGCELTWPMRHASLYSKPFRIKRRVGPEPKLEEQINIDLANNDNGPLAGQSPGDLTRWMAVPWHGDTAFCRSGYEIKFDPFLPTFWPARVPNQVLSAAAYAVVMDPKAARADRLAAFKHREHWTRFLTGSAPEQMKQMVKDFPAMGVVEARPGFLNDPDFPSVMFVESLPPSLMQSTPKPVVYGSPTKVDKVKEAGWESREQLEEFRRIRLRRRPTK